jgi:hypothetical protein
MYSKEWHRDRIEELKLKWQHNLDLSNNILQTKIGVFSIFLVVIIYYLSNIQTYILELVWTIILLVLVLSLLDYADKRLIKELKIYDKHLKRNYDALLDREPIPNL